MKKVSAIFFVFCASMAFAQSTSKSVDTTNYMIYPKLAITVAPLAMADYETGSAAKVAMEYRLSNRYTGLTEFSYLMPWHRTFTEIRGFKIRQDIRRYDKTNHWFSGGSIMFKKQEIDHIAVIPITDSTYYTKPYTLNKVVFAASFVFGGNIHFNHMFFEASIYGGIRVKNAVREGLTGSEMSRMWNSDMDYARWAEKYVIRDGLHVGIELQPCLRVGWVF